MKYAWLLVCMGVLATARPSCFEATRHLNVNAQNVRLTARSMGWRVGKIKSFAVATAVKAKQKIYPDGKVTVCLEVRRNKLGFVLYSTSIERPSAKWHFLKATRKGIF